MKFDAGWLRVQGNLDLTGCASLTELPFNLRAEGDLILTGSGITWLKNADYVFGKIHGFKQPAA
ncbi:hypothetical protein N185_34415 [Sinorhizobium sp. GW3]|nr:hypothetical protein N185_34415 [Sinorhizobium sp. GW3]